MGYILKYDLFYFYNTSLNLFYFITLEIIYVVHLVTNLKSIHY